MKRPSRVVGLQALRAEEANSVLRKPGLTPVGVSRALPSDVLQQGEWAANASGKQVWRVALESAGADGIRVHFSGFHIGAGSVWLFAKGEDGSDLTFGPYTKEGLLGDGDFWSDMVPGSSVIVAYEPAEGAAAQGAPPFQLKEISHRFAARREAAAAVPAADGSEPERTASAASCALDVACYTDYSDAASAIALMVFQSDGASYECTGSLISSAAQPVAPLFLTANHCISTPAEARSLITYFRYQNSTCAGTPPKLSSLPRVVGASLIAGQPMAQGDFTLLQLSAFPDTDVKVLGWYTSDIGFSAALTGISHPRGDYKRIAFGTRTRDVTIRFSDGDSMPAAKGIQVAWTQGLTQSGSSGSPLLALIDGKQYVAGTLSAGPDIDESNTTLVCSTRNRIASYGRFSAAYEYLSGPLNSTTAPVPVSSGGSSSVVSAASQQAGPVAPDSLATLYGSGLATATAGANSATLPTSLGGVAVDVTDATGVTRPASLLYVSPTQVNLLVPAGTAAGTAHVSVRSGGTSQTLDVPVSAVAPALFSADGSGSGVGAILAVRQSATGQTQSFAYSVSSAGTVRATPIPLGSSDQVYLSLFGTGLRGAVPSGPFTATIGGMSVPVAAVAAQPAFAGLDQVNLGPIPLSLAGRGTVPIVLSVQGRSANVVTVAFQ